MSTDKEQKTKSPIKSVIINKFDDNTVQSIRSILEIAIITQQPFLPIYISSYGGSVYHLLNMISILKSKPEEMEIHTIVSGHAMSAGALLFCFGDRRFIAPDAYLMLHDIATMTAGKLASIDNNLKHTKTLKTKVFKLTSKKIGQSANWLSKELRQRHNEDWYINAEEALACKIATHIDLPHYVAHTVTEYQCLVPGEETED